MSGGGLLLYGANGYTGRLILEVALREGIPVTIAGRRKEAIEPLASSAGTPHVIFDLADGIAARGAVRPFDVLLLAAGPFSRTSAPALAACLAAKTDYIDITGEIDVFEALFARDGDARAAGISVLPGSGFDVVPTDCLAALLAEALPGADRLTLAFRGFRPSPGTAKTMLEGIRDGGRVRAGGRLLRVPPAWKTREIPFSDRTRSAMTVPWGDLATAWRSTGIGNIETYAAASPRAISTARRIGRFSRLLGLGPLRALLERGIGARVSGPSREERKNELSRIWGRVDAPDGAFVEGRMTTLEGYAFTAESSVACAREVLARRVGPGVWTPSRAFGPHFAESIAGTWLEMPSASGSAG